MSVIQRIRDKGALISAIIIAISLIGFILMDAFSGKTGLGSNAPSNTLGKVNGKTIDRMAFAAKIDEQEKQAQSQGAQLDEAQRQQMQTGLWNQEVTNIIMEEQYEKLGLVVTDKELRGFLLANPSEEIKQQFKQFIDSTGKFNAVAAQQGFNTSLKEESQKENARNYFLMQKYTAMLTNTIYFPKWFLEKRNIDNSMMGRISYVTVPYTTIADSTIKISDEEIEAFIKKHKESFEQKEETRTISFVSFSASPSSADSAAAKSELEKIKTGFATATDPAVFINTSQSVIPYADAFAAKSTIQSSAKDSILALPVGGVYGPYLDVDPNSRKSMYVLAKMTGTKSLPDSVKARHILIGTTDPQTGQPIMPDSIAKIKIDSIAIAIKNGASFDLLDSLFSTDQVAKKDKGVMTFSSETIQGPNFAKEFGQFVLFDGKPGDKKPLKTQFGWHYIEILEHKNVQQQYKIAYVGKEIVPSNETDQLANNQANLFAGESRDLTSFNANYDKTVKPKGILKSTATVAPLDAQLQGVQANARNFVRKVYEADKGDIIGPERVGENYIVGIITEITEPGLPSIASMRTNIEPYLKNIKKGEMIRKNTGTVTSLEQVSTKMAQPVQVLDSIRFSGNSVLGFEPKILGAIFNPANKNKVVAEPIAGTNGVYAIRVENTTTVPVDAANIEEQRKMMEQQAKQGLMSQMQQGSNPFIETLKRAANIKDNRYKFY